MIFQNIPQVLDGSKTVTWRLVKPGDVGWTDVNGVFDVRNANDNTRWYRGQEVAVQPGRGMPAVLWEGTDWLVPVRKKGDSSWWYEASNGMRLETKSLSHCKPVRIRILRIRQEDVRQISEASVKAVGFEFRYEFLKTWTAMHDEAAHNWRGSGALDDWLDFVDDRPAENYLAWALKFEVIE